MYSLFFLQSSKLTIVSFQLTFDTFTVGKFVSFTADGCPDGHMSIRESERPDTEGQWCGSAWGYTVYYSEGHSLNVTLLLEKLSEQVGAADGCFILLVQATKTIVIVWLQAIQKSHVGFVLLFVLIITCCVE